jgi:hypothetical protein
MNRITCVTMFRQSDRVYENIEKSLIFESEKNKLTYDDEIECIYLIGDFTVETPGEFTELDRNAIRYSGPFAVSGKAHHLFLRSIVTQGFPFFSGTIKLSHSFTLDRSQIKNRFLALDKISAMLVRVSINGQEVGKIHKAPYELSLDGSLKEGTNIMELEFVGTLRNLLGPHHLKEGECFRVGPFSFFQSSKLWNRGENADWTDEYCFVNFVGEPDNR